ncbi:hypothetical protein NQ318_022191 [Aromia moschata]|uniref:Secreted protein n=1 Tax=Aromia moschata TaxID=1265417 RepID=A0AAV8Z6K1_9CUCU|nr:hypothetical protein NQ318_022191 [Aromia moschata]
MELLKLKLCPYLVLSAVIVCGVLHVGVGMPAGNLESPLEVMAQVPQWHCMRYRKFELVRRCRSYKNSLRRS